jgi:hypothetical protein
MNILANFSESLETVLELKIKILKFFDADPDLGSRNYLTLNPGSGMEKFGSGIRDRKIRIQDSG